MQAFYNQNQRFRFAHSLDCDHWGSFKLDPMQSYDGITRTIIRVRKKKCLLDRRL